MLHIILRSGEQEYIIDTQALVPGKKFNEFYKADEVKVFKNHNWFIFTKIINNNNIKYNVIK